MPRIVYHSASGWLCVLFASLLVASAQETNGIYPIDLPTTLRLAGARNLDVQIAREQLRQAEAEHSSAVERFFPWIAPSFTYHRRDGVAQAVPSGIISDAHFQSYSPGIAIAAQLDLGDALYQSLSAKQLVHASDQALETQRQQALLDAARGYFELARAKALVEVASNAVSVSQDYQQQLHVAVTSGLAFKGDELRVQTQTKQYQMTLRQAVESQRVAGVQLARVLHLDSRVELVPQDSGMARLNLFATNASANELVEQALAARPELRENQALISAAREDKKGAVYGPLIPTLNAQAYGGGLGGGPDSGPDHFAAEGDYLVGLSWRVGPGGLFDPGRVHSSKAKLAQAMLSGDRLKDEITAEVVTALARLQSQADQIALAEEKLAAAEETMRVTHERKQFGVGIVLEDIQAQQDLERARADYVTALAEYNKAQYTLSRAVGIVDKGRQ